MRRITRPKRLKKERKKLMRAFQTSHHLLSNINELKQDLKSVKSFGSFDSSQSAPVVKLVDTQDLKSWGSIISAVPVQVRPGAPTDAIHEPKRIDPEKTRFPEIPTDSVGAWTPNLILVGCSSANLIWLACGLRLA